jgi:hypothetical protein
MVDSLRDVVRFSLATLRRSPAFSSLAVCVLALGVGLSAAIFSIVSESVAARLWPGQTPIGKRLTEYNASVAAPRVEWLTVVGVAADVHPILRPSTASPMVYVAITQQWRPNVGRVLTRTAAMPSSLLAKSHKRFGPRILTPMSIASACCPRSLGRCFIPVARRLRF